jgi:hypothetical protein
MSPFWKTSDGRLRKKILALLAFAFSEAVVSTVRDGWSLLCWAPLPLLLIGLILLARPARRWSPGRVAGGGALLGLRGIYGYQFVTGLIAGWKAAGHS